MVRFPPKGDGAIFAQIDFIFTQAIETEGLEKVLIGAFHIIQKVPLRKKCRIVLEYDPAFSKASIETFTSIMEGIQNMRHIPLPEHWI